MSKSQKIKSYYRSISHHQNQISNLENDLAILKKNLKHLFDDKNKLVKMTTCFQNLQNSERQNLKNIELMEQVKTAKAYSQDMFGLLTGTKHEAAVDGMDKIRVTIKTEISNTEQEIREKEMSILNHQQQIKQIYHLIADLEED